MSLGAGATTTQTPQPSDLDRFSTEENRFFTTILQQSRKTEYFLYNDTKYLQKISKTYFLVLRMKNKIFKRTLRTSNIKTANIRKIRILDNLMNDKSIPDYMKSFTAPSKDMLKIIAIIEDGDDMEEAKKTISSINRTANNKVEKSDKLTKLSTETIEEIKYSTLEEEIKNFYNDYRKTKGNAEARITEFQTTFKYLYLKFPKETRLLYILKYEEWENFRDFLIQLPNNVIRRYGSKKHGTDIEFIIESILNECEEKEVEPKLLNARTINKHFNIFSMFLNYLEKTQKIPSNPIRGIAELKEEPNPYKNYTDEDLTKLFNIKDYETKQFFKVALYTGLRLSAIISIKKEI